MSELQDLIQKAKNLENAKNNIATSANQFAPFNAQQFIEKAKNLELQKKGFNPDGTIGEAPSEFIFDPQRNQYVDTALIAKREGQPYKP